ncbi:YrhC family protein [Bacillus sp. CMF12]|uniref:YrhC family protein n=1 Tax=Bacillaceae TaxID=186817 RepID=UPI001FB49D4E|nr:MULTISPECIES: YrhC family protein [Bacillaceae]MDF2038710.1 YrhC family protein [Cytobacillus oceanisediminis]UOE54494.1 YrhC family protein [Cytobacillus oceanisediminis]USK49006.1 YrhC family protein [Bacillus sp. CMF12]
MKNEAKHLFEKMVDFKRFAISMLAVGSFFYIGLIIPDTANAVSDLYIMAGSSSAFLFGSILFFILSKRCRSKLNETDKGQEYLMRK